ncbi:hypothetical protein JAAARDRAFT_715234 [Jaapia argillacea MUCL 33604]|uniref:Uncharacterized protein n=1 Tax=Jaapia argillacea MUCL 33604 TaxID=933084 RepID=A0A067PVY7_9AGAM|nr:hypothetical protein JAAARDRAFT_715234 [Jaapia argillacea MUCL 33604]
MMSTRSVGLGSALRRGTFAPKLARNPAVFRNVVAKRYIYRTIQTTSLPPSAAREILNKQRLFRPSSPHFTIYQPQLTWLSSIVNRVTGAALSSLMYAFALAYLAFPTIFSGENIVGVVEQLPTWAKYSGKAILAAPFSFHALNGIRHLGWDIGFFLNLKTCYQAGYAVLIGTAAGTVGLCLM